MVIPNLTAPSSRFSTALLLIALIVFIGVAGAWAQETDPLYGPVDPPPLGVIETFTNGSAHDGDIGRPWGETGDFAYIVLATLTDVWWSPLADEVKLSLDDNYFTDLEIMDFQAVESNLPNGFLVWEGSSHFCGPGYFTFTRCEVTITDDLGNRIALTDPAFLGLPASIGGMALVSGTDEFHVFMQMFASWDGVTWQPHLDFYDYWSEYYDTGPGCSGQAVSSLDWGYYWIGAPPWMVAIAPLEIEEGATGTIIQELLDSDDIESPAGERTYTIGPGSNNLPTQYGTVYLDGVPLGGEDTFTQADVNASLVTYEHDGGEMDFDSFTFTCMDADSMLAADGPYTVFQFNIQVAPINDGPVAYPDTFLISMGQSFTDTLRAEDPDSTPLLYILTESGELGHAILQDINTGIFEYTALPEVTGVDTLRFYATDGDLDSDEVDILIVIGNSPPIAIPGSGITRENVALAGTLEGEDLDTPVLVFAIEENGSMGTAVITDEELGTFVYTPDLAAIGEDAFTFTVDDGVTTSAADTFRVTIRPNLDLGDLIAADGGRRAVVLTDPLTAQQAEVSADGYLEDLRGIALTSDNELLVVDHYSGVILVDPATGEQSVNCSGDYFSVEPFGPFGIAIENEDTYLVADGPEGIKRVDFATGTATVFVEGGLLTMPVGLCVGPEGDIYVADAAAFLGGTSQIVHIDPVSGDQTLISLGNNLTVPFFLCLDEQGQLVVSDAGGLVEASDQILRVDPLTGDQEIVTSDGLLDVATGIGLSADGDIWVNSAYSSSIIHVDPVSGDQTAVVTGGLITTPFGLVVITEQITAVEIAPALPAAFALLPAAPNPFNPRTDLRFELPQQSVVSLKVFDLSGRLIKTLVAGERWPAGRHAMVWDGRDNGGQTVPSGIYFYRIVTEGFTGTGKMTLLK